MSIIYKKCDRIIDPIKNSITFIILLGSLCSVSYFATESKIVTDYPKIVIYLYGFAFAKLVGHLQLAHVCKSHFYQFSKSILSSSFIMIFLSLTR